MFLSIAEIELLKLIGFCKHIPADVEKTFKSRIFSRENFSTLSKLGYITTDKTRRAYRLTPLGNKQLQRAGYNFPFDAKPRNEENVIKRRIASARTLITFYRAGINVFNDKPENLEEGGFLPSFALRRDKNQKSSLLNSTVFMGAYSSQEALYIVFNVTDTGNSVYYSNEIKTFNGLFSNNGANRSIIFMGSSTAGIAEVALDGDTARRKNGSHTFAGVYKYSTLPVHFIPTNDDGALMLRLMGLNNYRDTITKTLLFNAYEPPAEGFYDTDATHGYITGNCAPAAITADMDVKRLDRVSALARETGYERPVFYVLPEQEAFVHERYELNGDITMLFDMEPFLERMGKKAELFDVADRPFASEEGRNVRALLDF